MEQVPAEIYIAARRALLDALDALVPHRDAIIVVGAQAVYLRTETTPIGVAPYTEDADLAIDPAHLAAAPPIEEVLSAAGFRPSKNGQPGSFTLSVSQGEREYPIDVDLMVPEKVAAGSGRRSAQLDGHDRMVARRTLGLEAALVDHDPILVAALDENDRRHHLVDVAGPGALLVAKLHKLSERTGAKQRADRVIDKDAGDVYRLFQATSILEMARRLRMALAAEVAADVTRSALEHLQNLFGRRAASGIELAARSLGASEAATVTMTTVCVNYVGGVLEVLSDGGQDRG